MRLNPEQRTFVADLIAEAHTRATRPDGSLSSRAVPVHFVDLLGENEGAAPRFVGDYLLTLAIKGAAKVCADWRRSQTTTAPTRKGRRIDVPAFASARRRKGDGSTEYVQVPLPGMTLAELRSLRASLEKGRNTTSARISTVARLIEVCEAEGFASADEALDHMLRGAA